MFLAKQEHAACRPTLAEANFCICFLSWIYFPFSDSRKSIACSLRVKDNQQPNTLDNRRLLYHSWTDCFLRGVNNNFNIVNAHFNWRKIQYDIDMLWSLRTFLFVMIFPHNDVMTSFALASFFDVCIVLLLPDRGAIADNFVCEVRIPAVSCH